DNSYARLPDRFYARLAPTPVSAPRLVKLNRTLALELGLDPEDLTTPEGVALLAGNRIAPGSEPIALAYAGHQFGNFVPQLGDGRALLLGEVVDVKGVRRDIQLKGSGPTPFSRNGDGRAAIGPVLREYIISEALVAQWLLVGFIHGVMNTDNMSIAGETIDYGPCAFMDAYHPETVFSSIDRLGRYAYGKQPQIAGWNLARLGEALMPLFDDNEERALEQANESLKSYGDLFGAAYLGGLRRKFGFFTERDDDRELVQSFLKLLMDNGIDYTLAFRRLGNGEMPVDDQEWAARYRARLALEPQDEATRRTAMQAVNPLYIPRN